VERKQIEIPSHDYWVKVVEMLQHNWALMDRDALDGRRVRGYFLSDGGGVFDALDFDSMLEAERGLRRNGFQRYREDEEVQEFTSPPDRPFYKREHPNGKIYSSGDYWTGPPVSDS
jgi:hypothetical protein